MEDGRESWREDSEDARQDTEKGVGRKARMSKKRGGTRRGGRGRITVDYYYVNIEVAFILPPYARREADL